MNPSSTTAPTETRSPSPPLSSGLPQQADHSHSGSAAKDAKDTAREVKETVRQKGAEAADRIRERTEETLRDAKKRGSDVVCRQKDRAAERLADYEKALKAAASKLHESEKDHLGPYVEQAADQLGRVSGYLTAREPAELVDDAGEFARRNPEVVLGACVVVGLALGRFLKASKKRRAGNNRYGAAYADSSYGSRGENPYSPQI